MLTALTALTPAVSAELAGRADHRCEPSPHSVINTGRSRRTGRDIIMGRTQAHPAAPGRGSGRRGRGYGSGDCGARHTCDHVKG